MPRPANPFPKIRVHIHLPQPLYTRLMLLLGDENGLRFEHGALSEFAERAIRLEIERIASYQKEQACTPAASDSSGTLAESTSAMSVSSATESSAPQNNADN